MFLDKLKLEILIDKLFLINIFLVARFLWTKWWFVRYFIFVVIWMATNNIFGYLRMIFLSFLLFIFDILEFGEWVSRYLCKFLYGMNLNNMYIGFCFMEIFKRYIMFGCFSFVIKFIFFLKLFLILGEVFFFNVLMVIFDIVLFLYNSIIFFLYIFLNVFFLSFCRNRIEDNMNFLIL